MVFSSQLGEAQIAIRASTDQLQKDLGKAKRSVQSSLAGIQQKMRGFGVTASAAITAPLVLFGKKAVETAAAAEEMEDKLSIVFGNSADSVREWADETAKAIGRSSFEMRKAAADTQSLLISAGLAEQEATEMSKAMTQLAIDTASFNDVSDPQAINAFQKALLGENEALKGVGLSLSAAEVQAQALKLGFEGNVTQMDSATKAQATYQALLIKTTQMQGNAAQTVGSSTNQMKAFSAAMTDLSIVVGNQILPILTPMITALTSVLRAFVELPEPVQQFAVATGVLAAALGPLALLLSTISLPLLGIAAAVATVLVAWQNWDVIKNIVKDTYLAVKQWLQDKLGAVLDFVGEKVEKVTGFFYDMWDKVVGHSFVPDMIDGIESEFGRLDNVMVKPAEAATKKVTQSFERMGKDIQSGFGAGIQAGFGAAAGQISGSIGDPLASSFFSPIIGALGDKFGSAAASFFKPTGLAMGGPINRPTLVGERGPELFIPGQAGTVVSNKNLGGGVVVNQNISLMPDVGVAFKEQLAQSMPVIRSAAIQGVAEAQARRGSGGRR